MTILSFLSCTLPFFLVSIYHLSKCDATTYLVGGSGGWDLSTDLDTWFANKTFHAGDVLWFQYSRYHSVSEVDKVGYNNCNATNAILTSTIGSTNVTLKSPGTNNYFTSGKQLYCFGGMRLKTYVQKGNESSMFAPAASPVSPKVQPQPPPSVSMFAPAASHVSPKVQPQPPPSVSRHSDSNNISPPVTGTNVTNGYGNGQSDAVLGIMLFAVVSFLFY